MTSKHKIQQPDTKVIAERFEFVADDTLRQNISNALSFIIFLDSIENHLELPALYKNLVYKTIILYSASILESLLFFRLKNLIDTGRIDASKLGKGKPKYKDISKIIINKEGFDNPIVLCEKLTSVNKLKSNTQFKDIITYGKRCGLLDEGLANSCNRIKDLRNSIHLSSMTKVDDEYDRNQLNTVFSDMKLLIDRIKNFVL